MFQELQILQWELINIFKKMDFDIVKIGVFAVLIIVYLTVRKLLKKFADFTETIGNSVYHEEEIKTLESKIVALEEKINNKP